MKILYVTTVAVTMGFFPPHIRMLQDAGHTVELACNLNEPLKASVQALGCKSYNIPFSRSPLSGANLKAYRELKRVIEEGNYDIVHTHTPVASALVRIACRKLRKKGLRVIYTAHGFHFYTGAPKKNWLIFYPVEKLCAKWTDVLVTINKEDYARAKKKFRAGRVEYVPGVGIDTARFANIAVDRSAKRTEIGIPEDAYLILSVGELNANKNHEAVIRAMAGGSYDGPLFNPVPDALRNAKEVHYAIAGIGELEDYLRNLAKELGVGDRLHLLGYRSDCPELYKTADLFVLPSIREGLNVSLQEARAAGTECRAFPIRGNTDILETEDISIFDIGNINRQLKEIYDGLCVRL